MKHTRKSAIQAGDPKYKTGKPCKYGHLSERWTIDGACIQCRLDHTKQERALIRQSLAQ